MDFGLAAAAIIGSFLLHALSGIPSLVPPAHAAWCWPSQPPKCRVANGLACKEGTTIPEGGTCTPDCPAPKVPTGTCTLECPPVDRSKASCVADLDAQTWWDPCGYGPRCRTDIVIGGAGSRYGSFRCVDPAPGNTCVNFTLTKPTLVDYDKWDIATILFAVGLVLVVLVGALIGRFAPVGVAKILFWPGAMSWTLANAFALLLLVVGFIVYIGSLASGISEVPQVLLLGLAAGLASSLPLWWAFFKGGVHSAMGMSREAAWRIHIVLGDVSLVLGTIHGIFAMIHIETVFDNAFFILGLVGLILMWIGVLPAAVHRLAPKVLTYDRWKLLHFMSMIGYILALLHMIDHASKFQTARSILVTVLNALALAAFVVQKIIVKVSATKAMVESAEVMEEPDGRHIVLRLKASGFSYEAGQWGYLSSMALSPVPHPFTIVPDENGYVRFMIKATGKFTQLLAERCSQGQYPSLSLEGPFGLPPIPSTKVDAAVFVHGGIGITPALSLLPEAHRAYRGNVALYWSSRSPWLLQQCAPFLEPSVTQQTACVRITATGSRNLGLLPLWAKEGREDLTQWLEGVAAHLEGKGVCSALLFVCGPSGLVSSAKAALGKPNVKKFPWQLHVEEFLFLPHPPGTGSGKKRNKGASNTSPELIGARQT